jgi:hypothetical protein
VGDLHPEEWYKDLERLYSSKAIKSGSAGDIKIRKIVNLIIGEIAYPLDQKLNTTVADNTFDGEIIIDDAQTVLYKIYMGNLSSLEFERLVDMTRTIGNQGKAYLLIVTREISDADRRTVDSLRERVNRARMTAVFIDYRSLISLHSFCSNVQIEHVKEEQRIFKKLFLENLLGSSAVISQELFDDAWSAALDEFYSKLQSPNYGTLSTYPRISQQRLERLGRILQGMLDEIRELGKNIRSEIAEARMSGKKTRSSIVGSEAPYIIDLRQIEGDGEFPCPVCTSMISPDDESEENYRVINAKAVDEELEELTLQCRACGCIIKLVGFREPFSYSEEE